jgi:hypothetical protein
VLPTPEATPRSALDIGGKVFSEKYFPKRWIALPIGEIIRDQVGDKKLLYIKFTNPLNTQRVPE